MGCIAPLCSLITYMDSKIVMVVLEALHAILRVGKKIKETEGLMSNPFADLIDQADGTCALEKLQDSNNEAIFKKVGDTILTETTTSKSRINTTYNIEYNRNEQQPHPCSLEIFMI